MESPSHDEDMERVRQGRLELRERYATGHKEIQARKEAVQRQLSPAPEAIQADEEVPANEAQAAPANGAQVHAADPTRKCPESHGGKGE